MRTLRPFLASLAVGALLAGLIGSHQLLASQEIIVAQDGSGAHTTITDAVAAASDGDTILVRPGTYDESVLVAKDIIIRGDGDVTSVIVERSGELPRHLGARDDPGLPYAFRFDDCDATLENLTVRGDMSRISIAGGAPTLRGLSLEHLGDNLRATEGNWHDTPIIGLEIMDGSAAIVEDSTVIETDLFVDSDASPTLAGNELIGGIVFVQDDGVSPSIDGNVFRDAHTWFIWVGGGAKPEISGNTFSGSHHYGIFVRDAARPDGVRFAGTDPLVRGNTISGSPVGVFLEREASARIEGNDLRDNQTGIMVEGSDPRISGNAIHENGLGVSIMRGAPELSENVIEGNKAGLLVGPPAEPTLAGNRICDNDTNVRLMRGAEMPATEGNEVCADA
jgi:parallel beta-helix repeat protein